MNPTDVAVLITDDHADGLKERLLGWAQKLNLSITDDAKKSHLTFLEGRLVLRHSELPRLAPLVVDLVGGDLGHRRKYGRLGKNQLLGKALGLSHFKHPRVIDATGGLGADSISMRILGCSVTFVERSPLVFALFCDAVERALQDEEAASLVASGLETHWSDSSAFMAGLVQEQRPDVVHLDPMFPPKRKTALAKGEMQYLQRLLSQEESQAFSEARSLLEAALPVALRRVVVKRPLKAEPLLEPVTHVFRGTTIRYDVYQV